MADLLSGGGVSNGNGASPSRPTAGPAPTGSPSQGIRGPRMIMHERREREARQRAERERAEEEARIMEEQRRREAERRGGERGGAGAGAATGRAGGPGGVSGGGVEGLPLDPVTQRRQQRAQQAQSDLPQGASPGVHQSTAPLDLPLRPTRVPTGQAGQQYSGVAPITTAPIGADAQPGEPSAAAAVGTRPRNSFPHAFERWEALSAHWEGMTSFWIRKLQENTDEVERNPISSQLSRQVSDLSAAGANLFHAVVELQRLRASSERKFQRWFFETRAELERNREVHAQLQAALDEERRGRADAIRDAVDNERVSSKTQRQLSEMRKELMISKEEARRAWEELGRREQEERDRTVSLQQGLPTIVGGVQVVPMTQGVPSRQTSTREQASYTQGEPYEYAMTQASRPEYSQAPSVTTSTASAPVTSAPSGYNAQGEPVTHEGRYTGGAASEGTFSEEDYDTPVEPKITVGGTTYPPSSSQWAGAYSAPPDYTGQAYQTPSWDAVPRHHHPTRLSDVIEEDDERSRTSASRTSASRTSASHVSRP